MTLFKVVLLLVVVLERVGAFRRGWGWGNWRKYLYKSEVINRSI